MLYIALDRQKALRKSNEVQVKSTLVKKYFATLQSTQKSTKYCNEVLRYSPALPFLLVDD